MTESAEAETHVEAGPIRITIEIDRPRLGLSGARSHMRSGVREILLSLREVLDAGIESIDKREAAADPPEKIPIE